MSTEVSRYLEAWITFATYTDCQITEAQIVIAMLGRTCQQVGVDFLSWVGTDYLVTVDMYSNFLRLIN